MPLRPLFGVLIAQVVLAAILLILVATGTLNFFGEFADDGSGSDSATTTTEATPAAATIDRFDEDRAWTWVKRQVALGPRPAGSKPSKKLAAQLRRALPRGKYQAVPKGLRNVVGTTPGKDPDRYIVVGAHYDTKDLPGFVGANDGAGGTAALVELARGIKPRTVGPTIVWIAFDGEEAPRGKDEEFERYGIRGAKVAARKYKDAEAMILLDFVADKDLATPREQNSDAALWMKLREAAAKTGNAEHFPDEIQGAVSDDHIPFVERGIPSIDLIDFDFPCWHQTCDDLTAVSKASLDASGETVREFLLTFR